MITSEESTVKAKPERMPSPTSMPFMLAISLLFAGWGLLTTWLIFAAGLVGMFISLTGWIKAICHEDRKQRS